MTAASVRLLMEPGFSNSYGYWRNRLAAKLFSIRGQTANREVAAGRLRGYGKGTAGRVGHGRYIHADALARWLKFSVKMGCFHVYRVRYCQL